VVDNRRRVHFVTRMCFGC